MDIIILPDPHNDEDLRHRNNLIAIAFVLALAIIAAIVIKMMVESEKNQRCLATGRRDCVEVAAPPRNTP